MARFIGQVKTIKIDSDGKVQILYDIQANPSVRDEVVKLLNEFVEGLHLQVTDPLMSKSIILFVLVKQMKLEPEKAQLTIDLSINDEHAKSAVVELIYMQQTTLVFELSQKPFKVLKKEAA